MHKLSCVLLPAGCREAATCRYCFYSVAKNQHFAPYRKNYELDRKMDDTFYDGHDELYHHAKFGEDRPMRAGCRCENMVFFCWSRSESVTYLLTVRSRGA